MTGSPAQRVARLWWTAERFGLTPRKCWARVSNRSEPRVLCICIPKSGTHLLERALCLHPRLYRRLIRTINDASAPTVGALARTLHDARPGQVLVSHLAYSPERLRVMRSSGVRHLLLVRDPRDVVVSTMFYIMRQKEHQFHDLFLRQPSERARLRLAIMGCAELGFTSVAEHFAAYRGWLDSGGLVVRFEDLVGVRGGGDGETQLTSLGAIFQHLGTPVEEAGLQRVANRLFSSNSPTFRKGTSGDWRTHFDSELQRIFIRKTQHILEGFGYQPE